MHEFTWRQHTHHKLEHLNCLNIWSCNTQEKPSILSISQAPFWNDSPFTNRSNKKIRAPAIGFTKCWLDYIYSWLFLFCCGKNFSNRPEAQGINQSRWSLRSVKIPCILQRGQRQQPASGGMRKPWASCSQMWKRSEDGLTKSRATTRKRTIPCLDRQEKMGLNKSNWIH